MSINLKSQLAEYGIRADKSLGQNFLLDMNITRKIARIADVSNDDVVLEVGPGPGGLTLALMELSPHRLIAIEKDRRFYPLLKDMSTKAGCALELLENDALKVDYQALAGSDQSNDSRNKKLKIVANLPYNISTILLAKWLETPEIFTSLTLMFQKEVAERLVSKPGSKSYGRISVITQLLCETSLEYDLPPEVFTPSPKVSSAVVKLIPRPSPLYDCDIPRLRQILLQAFNHRRKMLKVSLKHSFLDVESALTNAGIDITRRPESLTIEEFSRLSTLSYDSNTC